MFFVCSSVSEWINKEAELIVVPEISHFCPIMACSVKPLLRPEVTEEYFDLNGFKF